MTRYTPRNRPVPWAALTASLAVLLPLTACGDMNSQAQDQGPWEPTQNVAMTIHADAGGSSDLLGRTVAETLQDEGIVEQSVTAENRPGGSGAVAYTYMLGQEGNPHALATLSSSYLTTAVRGQADYSYKDFTNLAVLATDGLMFAVSADSEYKTLDDLVTAAEKNPGDVRFGGTQIGGADSIVRHFLEEETGAEFNYVSFDGGGEVNAALLGGDVDVIAANPAELKGLMDAERIRGLAVTLPERLEGLDVPTAKEEGVDITFTQARGIIGPPGLTQGQRTFWAEALKKTSQTDAWDKYLKANMLSPDVHVGDDAEKYVAQEWDKYVDIYDDLGLTTEGS